MSYKVVVVWKDQMEEVELPLPAQLIDLRQAVYSRFSLESEQGDQNPLYIFGRLSFWRTADQRPIDTSAELRECLEAQNDQEIDTLIISFKLLQASGSSHAFVVCDRCERMLSCHWRYTCLQCSTIGCGYDLCEDCEGRLRAGHFDHEGHNFVKIATSSPSDTNPARTIIRNEVNSIIAATADPSATHAAVDEAVEEAVKPYKELVEAQASSLATMEETLSSMLEEVQRLRAMGADLAESTLAESPTEEAFVDEDVELLSKLTRKLEVGISWSGVIPPFRERRDAWIAEVAAANSAEVVAELLHEFYMFLIPELRNAQFDSQMSSLAGRFDPEENQHCKSLIAGSLKSLEMYLKAMGRIAERPEWWHDGVALVLENSCESS